MKTRLYPLAIAVTLICGLSSAGAQSTAFTYQGRLNDGGNPASGLYDLRFTIYDAAGGSNVVAGPLTNSKIEVGKGLFTTTLDFGSSVFNGADRWLEIGVRTNGSIAGFTTLSPRQLVVATPYALYAPNASVNREDLCARHHQS